MISKRQKQIYEYIKKYIIENDYAPTLDEIRIHFKLSSVSTIHHHISKLQKDGLIKKIKNEPRSIFLKEKQIEKLLIIPILGTIAAKKPIKAIEKKETLEIPKSQLPKTGTYYVLRVMGNSMTNEGIYDGDFLIVRKQHKAKHGDTIIALIRNNKLILKRIFEKKNGHRLKTEDNINTNSVYAKGLNIQGKVIQLIRNY